MISKLFVNACIVFTLTFLGFIPFRNRQIRQNPSNLTRLLTGIVAGAMGVILMFYSVPIPDSNLIVDLRHLPVIVCAVFLGPWASITAGITECFARMSIFGVSETSVIAGLNMLVIGIVSPMIARLSRRMRTKVAVANIYAFLESSVLLYWLAPHKTSVWQLCLVYWVVALIAGYASAWLIVQLINHFDHRDHLEHLSSVDFLTGLNNTRKFDLVFNDLTLKAVEYCEPLSLLAIDIDHFKRVNDTYGHPAGDAVLRQLADLLTRTRRSIDTVFRNGGEEFTVLMPNCRVADAMDIAERIRTAVENAEFWLPSSELIHITVSIGVSTYSDSTDEVSNLIQIADEGLYRAKRDGRNRVCFATDIHLEHHVRQMS